MVKTLLSNSRLCIASYAARRNLTGRTSLARDRYLPLPILFPVLWFFTRRKHTSVHGTRRDGQGGAGSNGRRRCRRERSFPTQHGRDLVHEIGSHVHLGQALR
jgi:hypothetical protein